METFEIIVNNIDKNRLRQSTYLAEILTVKYNAQLKEEVDWGPYKEEIGFFYYGKPIKGKLLQIEKCFFEEIANKYFPDELIIWNFSTLDIYSRGNWNIELINKYKSKIRFNSLLFIDSYNEIFSKLENVVLINNEKVWHYFFTKSKNYKLTEVVSFLRTQKNESLNGIVNLHYDYKLEEIFDFTDLIIPTKFSRNKAAIAFYFEIDSNLIDLKSLSKNEHITQSFLQEIITSSNFPQNFQAFDWEYAIQNCSFEIDIDLVEQFQLLLDEKPNLYGLIVSKIISLDKYKMYFENITYDMLMKYPNQNIICDIDLFQKILNKLDYDKYSLSKILNKLLLSKEVILEFSEILKSRFKYEKKIYSSWSEGSIYSDTTVNLKSLILNHSELDNIFLDEHL